MILRFVVAVASVSSALALHSTSLDCAAHVQLVMCLCVPYFLVASLRFLLGTKDKCLMTGAYLGGHWAMPPPYLTLPFSEKKKKTNSAK